MGSSRKERGDDDDAAAVGRSAPITIGQIAFGWPARQTHGQIARACTFTKNRTDTLFQYI